MLTTHKPSKKDDVHFHLPKLIINNHKIQREKFIGVLLDQHLTRKEHIKLTENKIAKNIGILYEARSYLDIRVCYGSVIHRFAPT